MGVLTEMPSGKPSILTRALGSHVAAFSLKLHYVDYLAACRVRGFIDLDIAPTCPCAKALQRL